MPQETKFLARNRKHSVKEWVKRVESDIFSKLSEVCTFKKRPLYTVHEIIYTEKVLSLNWLTF